MWFLDLDKKRSLYSVVRYRRMGLGKQAIAKLAVQLLESQEKAAA